MGTAALYARISSDRTDEAAGVGRQIEDCLAAAQRLGDVIPEDMRYVDNDVSAFSRKQRPAFERLLADIEQGIVTKLFVYHTDRLYRRLRDLVRLTDTLSDHPIAIQVVVTGELDLSTASGRMTASILGSVAEHESARQSERILRQKRQAAAEGKPAGGRSFGYLADMTVVPEEAALIREAVDRLLAGESLRSICAWITDSGVKPVRGGTWRQASIRASLLGSRLAGYRETRPVDAKPGDRTGTRLGVIQNPDGPPHWEPIIPLEKTLALRALLTDPKRKTTKTGKQMLTGLLRCGRCEQSMNSRHEGNGARRYACIRVGDSKKCGGLSIAAKQLEGLVVASVLSVVYASGPPSRFRKQGSLDAEHASRVQQQVADLQAQRKRLAREFADDLIGEAEFEDQSRAVKERITQVEQSAAKAAATIGLSGLPDTISECKTLWNTLSIDKQRAILASALDHITILPAKNTATKLDPERVILSWHPGV